MPSLVCPTCGRRVVYADRSEVPHRPFCSPRCQWLDLARWLNEEYGFSSPLGEGQPDRSEGWDRSV
ncbi:MAG TPA: DNA gyrase inhibitor YacG [Phycisphaerae bacterium]|nr:DNA gyrase inhibitor YacG [Phycisphaerae bacterium]